jgi:hypothetical protein
MNSQILVAGVDVSAETLDTCNKMIWRQQGRTT